MLVYVSILDNQERDILFFYSVTQSKPEACFIDPVKVEKVESSDGGSMAKYRVVEGANSGLQLYFADQDDMSCTVVRSCRQSNTENRAVYYGC